MTKKSQKKDSTPVYSMSVHDRTMLLNALPRKGHEVEARVIKELLEKLELSADELQRADIIVENGLIRQDVWDKRREFNTDVLINKVERGIIKKTLEKLEKAGDLPITHLDLWDTFC